MLLNWLRINKSGKIKKSTNLEKRGTENMNKIESIARRILGWKLNSQNKWYDFEKDISIHYSEFQPDLNLDHAMLIVKKLEKFGFTYTTKGVSNVCFNDVSATGDTLAQAITNAAHLIADDSSKADEWL